MTVLVTGAGGFLGDHLWRILRARGVPARGFDLHYPGGKHAADVTGSILDPEALSNACDGVEGVTLRDTKKDTVESLACTGVFVFVGVAPNTASRPQLSR